MNNACTPQPSPSLLRRTQFLPGESLTSLLERLTQLNYYPSSRILRSICRQRLEPPANQDDLAHPKWVETYLRLADLTHISPEELYAASDHRFAPIFTLPHQSPVEIPWIGSTSKAMLPPNLARERLHFASAAQYCPRCLKNAAYHRLNWIPISAAICLEHHCLLVSQCPQCRKHISIQEIIKQRCYACLADLSAAEPISVEGNELGILSQQIIQSWLAGIDGAELLGKCSLPSRHPAVLYRFLENLSRRLLDGWNDWPNLPEPLDGLVEHIPAPVHQLQTLTPAGIFHLQRAAFTGVTNWSDGLFQFLDAYTGCHSRILTPANYVTRLVLIRHSWFQPAWKTQDFEFMQQGFVNYSLTRNIPLPVALAEQFTKEAWFIEKTGLWSEETTAQTLGISVQKLRQLLPYGSVGSCRWPRSRAKAPLFERDKVLLLKQQWALGWPISDASLWLGLYSWDVVELAKRGVLAVVDRPDADEAHWVLSRQSVECFFEKIVAQLKLFQGDRHDLLCLAEAVRLTACLGMDCATLLQGVADGFLPALKQENEIHALWHIYFLEKLAWDLPDLCYARCGWITGHKFAHEKGFHPRLVTEWMEAGLIKPEAIFGKDKYFVRQLLEQIAAVYIPG